MYILHNDEDAFRTLITKISSERLIIPEIIEKDYFVTLILQEITAMQKNYDVFFKGGTALYKALKSINRFSEDIDLTFNDSNFDSKSSKKTALKRVTSEYKSLSINPHDIESVSGSGSRTSIYSYTTLFAIDTFKDDTLNRIGKLKIETTSFTTSSPVTTYEIEPILYTYSNEEFRRILEDSYDVRPFLIKCISIERIFIDKLFAIEDYYLGAQTNRLVEVSKHMYDVHQLFSLPLIRGFLKSSDNLKKVIKIKEEEQLRRREAKTLGKTIVQFEYFDHVTDLEIRNSYENMQRIYVFSNDFKVDFEHVVMSFSNILSQLKIVGL